MYFLKLYRHKTKNSFRIYIRVTPQKISDPCQHLITLLPNGKISIVKNNNVPKLSNFIQIKELKVNNFDITQLSESDIKKASFSFDYYISAINWGYQCLIFVMRGKIHLYYLRNNKIHYAKFNNFVFGDYLPYIRHIGEKSMKIKTSIFKN